MNNIKQFFFNKKILIYGLGKSGVSAFNFLKQNNEVFVYDDHIINPKFYDIKKNKLNLNKLIIFILMQ